MENMNKTTIAGIDHIGINVPDIDAATLFLQDAFGAEVMYESYSKEKPPLVVEDADATTLNMAQRSELHSCRMIKIGKGINIELFEIHVNGQRESVRSSDLGLQHFAVYTDDISGSLQRFTSAGGKVLSEPKPLLFPLETGEKNFFCYGITPWGSTVEFITYPEGMPYEDQTSFRRWKAGQ